MHTGVEDFNLTVGLYVTGSNIALALSFNINCFRAFAIHFCNETLDVEDNFRYTLFNTGDSRKLVLNAVNLD